MAGARREAAAAFGDGTVFLERYVADPRHIEVQILADAYGDTVALFERECTIQRRHQKIVEEAPSPVVTPELRARLVEAAVAAARAVGYVNAGTVEFVVDSDGDPSFLEMNTRLQVEHPVTEAVTGLDLVRLQLLIAGGRAAAPPRSTTRWPPDRSGHAIEARLYAEDPAQGWLPVDRHPAPLRGRGPDRQRRRHRCAGRQRRRVRLAWSAPTTTPCWPRSSPMPPPGPRLPRRWPATLARARIHGVTTNRDLLVRTLRHPEFLAGDTDTGFLDRHGLDQLADPLADGDAAATPRRGRRPGRPGRPTDRGAGSSATIPSGCRNNPSAAPDAPPTEATATEPSPSGTASTGSGDRPGRGARSTAARRRRRRHGRGRRRWSTSPSAA